MGLFGCPFPKNMVGWAEYPGDAWFTRNLQGNASIRTRFSTIRESVRWASSLTDEEQKEISRISPAGKKPQLLLSPKPMRVRMPQPSDNAERREMSLLSTG